MLCGVCAVEWLLFRNRQRKKDMGARSGVCKLWFSRDEFAVVAGPCSSSSSSIAGEKQSARRGGVLCDEHFSVAFPSANAIFFPASLVHLLYLLPDKKTSTTATDASR